MKKAILILLAVWVLWMGGSAICNSLKVKDQVNSRNAAIAEILGEAK